MVKIQIEAPWPKDAPSKRVPADLAEKRLALEARMDLGPTPDSSCLARFGSAMGLLPQRTAVLLLRLMGLCPRGTAAYRQMSLQRNPIALPGLAEDLAGLRMLQISDLHTDLNPTIIDAVAGVLPKDGADLTVLTGDFRCRATGDTAAALSGLARLLPQLPQPIFAILGNHDTLAIADWLEAQDIRVLMNEMVNLRGAGGGLIQLAGIDDAHYFDTHDLAAAVRGRDPNAPLMLLSHTPATWAAAQQTGVDYMLSGHTHGGQICLPGGRPIRIHKGVPKEAVSGPWNINGFSGYTCPGAGGSGIPTRINCPPQITLHVLG